MASHSSWHKKLNRMKGRASAHLCGCGRKARVWAYNNCDPDEIVDPNGMRWAANPDAYQPMCISCHVTFDGNNPQPGGLALAERLRSDPDFAADRSAKISATLKESLMTLLDDPVFARNHTTNSSKNAATTNAQRRRCVCCGREMSPGALGTHQRFTGHQGWEEA